MLKTFATGIHSSILPKNANLVRFLSLLIAPFLNWIDSISVKALPENLPSSFGVVYVKIVVELFNIKFTCVWKRVICHSLLWWFGVLGRVLVGKWIFYYWWKLITFRIEKWLHFLLSPSTLYNIIILREKLFPLPHFSPFPNNFPFLLCTPLVGAKYKWWGMEDFWVFSYCAHHVYELIK